MPHSKDKKRPQNRPHNQKSAGLVNSNHFYETADELANRHLQQHQQQQKKGKQPNQQSGQNPEQHP